MTMYWIYDLPNWTLGLLIVASFLAFSVAGLFVTRPMVRRLLGPTGNYNDVVSYFFAGIGVFYGLALGLIAVATWENYTDIDGVVGTEAAAVASFYRDLDGYPQPLRGRLENMMRDYIKVVIEKEWPAHKKGVALEDGDALIDQLEDEVMNFEPTREREKILQSEVLRSLDTVQEQRRLRLQAVPTGLPAALWAVVIIGAVLNVGLTYLFWVDNLRIHAILVGIMAVFIGLLVFLTAAMDNPFRGEFSITADSFRDVLENVMTPRKH
jgi:Protein of unknown function (DUF4239)